LLILKCKILLILIYPSTQLNNENAIKDSILQRLIINKKSTGNFKLFWYDCVVEINYAVVMN